MMFYLYLSWSLSLSGLYSSCLRVLDIVVKRKELLAVESDLSVDGSQVRPSLGGWPWENTDFWKPPFLGGVWSAKYKNNILRIVLKIGDIIHKTECLVKYQEKSIIIIIIIICDVILVNSYVPYYSIYLSIYSTGIY